LRIRLATHAPVFKLGSIKSTAAGIGILQG
jgi:hypothetical protein